MPTEATIRAKLINSSVLLTVEKYSRRNRRLHKGTGTNEKKILVRLSETFVFFRLYHVFDRMSLLTFMLKSSETYISSVKSIQSPCLKASGEC